MLTSKDDHLINSFDISYHFLDYLHKISRFGQFIIVENVDIPESLKSVIGVDTFYEKNAGQDQRIGLLE